MNKNNESRITKNMKKNKIKYFENIRKKKTKIFRKYSINLIGIDPIKISVF